MHDVAEITGSRNNAELVVSIPGVSDGESDAVISASPPSFKTGLAARKFRCDSGEATELQI